MSATYATPLLLDLKPSGYVRIYLLCVHLLALVAVWLLPLDWYLQLLILVLLGFSYRYSRRQQAMRYQLLWREYGWLVRSDDTEYGAQLLASSMVTAWLTVLSFRLETGQSLSLLILPDSLSPDQYRRLRVRLKVSGNKALAHGRIQP